MIGRSAALFAVGLVGGLCDGALGVSEAIVMVPALLILGLVKSYKAAIGTTLLAILPPLSILAMLSYYRKGLLDVQAAIILMISAIIGAGIGAHVSLKSATPVEMAYTTAGVYAVAAVWWLILAQTDVVKRAKSG